MYHEKVYKNQYLMSVRASKEFFTDKSKKEHQKTRICGYKSPPSYDLAPDTEEVLFFREINQEDIPVLRRLHEEWFPIRYNDAFYNGAAHKRWAETGGALFTRVVTTRLTSPSPTDPEHDQKLEINISEKRNESGRSRHISENAARDIRIIGAVTASLVSVTSIEEYEVRKILELPAFVPATLHPPRLAEQDDLAMYILTLGTQQSYRRRGVASMLLSACIDNARQNPHCKAVYLHVKVDNIQAIHFYERNGFQNVKLLKNYYMIQGVPQHAYLFIYFLNRDPAPTEAVPLKDQRSWLTHVSQWTSIFPTSVIVTLKSPSYLLGPLTSLFSSAYERWRVWIQEFRAFQRKENEWEQYP